MSYSIQLQHDNVFADDILKEEHDKCFNTLGAHVGVMFSFRAL